MKMGLKHKITDEQSPEKIKKKKQRTDKSLEEHHSEILDDRGLGGHCQSSPSIEQGKKKKPRKIEPYWSTSKAFVNALKEEDKIGAVINWLQAINENHKVRKVNQHSDVTDAETTEKSSEADTEVQSEDGGKNSGEEKEDEENMDTKNTSNLGNFADVIAPYVDAFFRAGGTVSSLLACGRLDTASLCSLFQALYHIMLRGNVLGEINPAWIKADCIEFLKLNADTTRHLLSDFRSARQNQVALEFLLAMTAVDNQVAVEVLGTADLTDMNVRHMTDESSIEVRKAYINLITGILVCGDPTLTRALLIRPYIVTYIIPSLQWDPADTVATFLTAVRCHLIQNRSILKIRKSAIFSGEILTSLLRLYRWGGPANKPATLTHLSKKNKAKSARPFNEVDKVELDTVIASVHSLLLIMLTDHTLGLVYKDLSIGTKAQRNYLISHIFRYVEKPWNIPALGKLFVHTLTANPDVIKGVLQSMKPALEPRPTAEWSKCLDLVEEVITGIHPEKLIEESRDELSLSHLMSAVVDLCVPQILVSVLCGENGSNLLAADGEVTHRIAQFLSRMLDNLSKVYDRMQDWKEEGKLSQNEITKVRRFVTEFLVRHFPPFSTLLKSCLAFMKAPDELKGFGSNATASDTSILKFLLMYLRLCSKEDGTIATADGENHDILMEMFDNLYVESNFHPYIPYDFYELLLALKEPSFVIENESRREHIEKLFCDVLSSDENISRRAKSVLINLIKNTSLFETNMDLAATWLDIHQKYLRVHDVSIMIESVIRAASDPASYRRKIEKMDEKTLRKMVENERLEESLNAQLDEVCLLFDRWEEEDPVLHAKSNLLCSVSYELNTITPWLPALLEVVKEHKEGQSSKQLRRREEFLRHLIVTLLFHSSQPATLIRLIVKRDRHDQTLPSDLMEYLKSWGPEGCPQPLFFKDDFVSMLCKFLLVEDSHEMDDTEFLQEQMKISLCDGKDESVARGEVVYVTRVVVFHVVEVAQRGMLTSLIAERCAGALGCSLALAHELRGETLRSCVQVFLSNFVVLSEFFPAALNRATSSQNLTTVVIKVLQKVSELSGNGNDESVVSVLKEPFKQKFISALGKARDLQSKLHRNAARVVVLFNYTFEEVTDVLTLACEMQPRHFWLETRKSQEKLAPWGVIVAHLLQVAADSKKISSLPDNLVTRVSENIAKFNATGVTCISALEKSFLSYLKFRPQQTEFVSKELLPSIFRNRSSSSEAEHLAVWLCKRFTPECLDNISSVMSSPEPESAGSLVRRSELLLESMKGAFSHMDENKKAVPFDSCVPIIGKLVRNAVTDETQRPVYLASYVDFVVTLLAKYKRFSVAQAALFSLLKTPPTVCVEKFFCVELIERLFWSVCGPSAHPPVILLYLKWLTVSLQKSDKKEDDVLLISKLCDALLKKPPTVKVDSKGKNLEKKHKTLSWDTVLDSDTWMSFVPLAVMFGLQPTYLENESKCIEARSLVLRALFEVCQRNFSHRADNVQIATIFKLLIKHSEFQSCMSAVGPIRLELVKLLKLLIEFSPSLIEGEHFPMLLSSYRATVEQADRIILQLLDMYESAGVVSTQFKTFLWGQDGASVYATMNMKNSLHEFDPNRVFSLFLADAVHQTILNFPLSRSLDVHEDYEGAVLDVYDPAFYMLILRTVTAPETPLKTFAFVRSGALALVLVALASEIEAVRTMAYSTLSGFVDHLYNSKGVQVDVLNRFMDSLRMGVTTIMKKDGSSSPRLSSIVAIFLARTSLIICNPLAQMYTTLNSFLLSKVEINLHSVPEFLACMHACSADFREQRTWMLEILASGLHTDLDFELCLNNEIPVLRLLMDMFTSCVTDLETKARILQVFTSAVALHSGASWLVFRCGLLAWLSSISLFRFVKTNSIVDALVTLIRTVWKTLTNENSPNSELPLHIIKSRTSCQLLRLLLSFTPVLPTMETKTMSAFLLTVHDTYKVGFPASSPLLNEDTIKSIIEQCSLPLSKDEGIKCLSILKYGCDFMLDQDENPDEVTSTFEAARNLINLTKTWVSLRSS